MLVKQNKWFFGAVVLVASHQVFASMDVDECEWWAEGCSMASYPFYAPANDTRSNLLMLASERLHFASPFPQLTTDERTSRATPFYITRLKTTDGFDETGSIVIPVDAQALMADARKMSINLDGVALEPSYTNVDGGRWVSNNPATLQRFFKQLLADDSLTDEQRRALANERVRLLRDSAEESALPAQPFPADSHAQAFRDYLVGIDAFYRGDFSNAETQFLALKQSSQPWVAETAQYMLFRIALNQIVEDAVDDMGMFDSAKSNKAAAALALERGDEYLSSFPAGQYVNSVQGLYRRINWYTGDYNALAFNGEKAISQATTPEALQSVINELDARLLGNQYLKPPFIGEPNSPQITFTQVLKRLRENYQTQTTATQVTAEELAGYKALFEKADMLPAWEYLQTAWAFYLKHDYAAVLNAAASADKDAVNDTLLFSQQVLRGLSMQELARWPDAEAYWRHLLTVDHSRIQQDYLQYQLANSLAQQGKVGDIFAANSPVVNLTYRSNALKMLASQDLLRKQVETGQSPEEQIIALHTLLAKELLNADYQGYLQDKPRTELFKQPVRDDMQDVMLSDFNWDGRNAQEGYVCHSLDDIVTTLAQRPKDARALNCLGEYFRVSNLVIPNGYDDGITADLTKAKSQYDDRSVSRLMHYQQVIAMPDAPPEDKSYALYRAVMCYAPTGENDCDRQDIDKNTRKAWFLQLKNDYPGSEWASRLRFYW